MSTLDSPPLADRPARRPTAWTGRLIGLAIFGGLVAGAAIGLLTDVISRTDIGGPGWSLRGNGAIIVPFVCAPAALAAGWAALTLAATRDRRWAPAGLVAGLAALLIGLLIGFVPLFLASPLERRAASPAVQAVASAVGGAVAAGGGLGLAALFGRPGRRGVSAAIVGGLVAVATGALSWSLAGFLFPLAVPAALVAPLATAKLAAPDARERPGLGALAAFVLLPPALIAGFIVTAAVAPPVLAATAPLPDGRVLAVGTAGRFTPVAEVYDPAAGTGSPAGK